MMAKSSKAFRRADLRRSKTAWLFCHILIAMSIGRMILQNHSLPNLSFGSEINRILD